MAEPTQGTAGTPPAPAAPAPGTPEYDAAMTAKLDEAGAKGAADPAEKTPEAPLILGKFKSQADLEAAYKELEGKLGAQKAPEKAPEAKPADDLKISQEAQDIVAKAGLKQEDLAAAFAKDGKLTDDQYKALGNVGVSKAMVDAFLAGQQAVGAQFESQVQSLVGGKDEFKSVTDWARANATPEQIAEYNAAVDEGNLTRIGMALSVFKAGYANANPKMVGGAPGVGAVGFRSNAEMVAAMSDPRYAKDEAYRQDVYAKIAAMR